MSLQGNGPHLTPQLLGSLIGVVSAVPAAAYSAAWLGDDYNTRALIYGLMLLWVVVGAAAIYIVTRRADPRNRLTLMRTALWCMSLWLWPVLVFLARHFRNR